MSPRLVAQSEDHFTALAFPAAGLGVTTVPRIEFAAAPPGDVGVGLTEPTPVRRVVAHVRADTPGDIGLRAVEILRQVASGGQSRNGSC